MDSKDNADAWASIRQYRKNLKPTKSFAHIGLDQPGESPFFSSPNHQRSLSQTKPHLLKESYLSIQEREQNGTHSASLRSPQPDFLVISSLHEAQPLVTPLSKIGKALNRSFQTSAIMSPQDWSRNSTVDQLGTDRPEDLEAHHRSFNYRPNKDKTSAKKRPLDAFKEMLDSKTARRPFEKSNLSASGIDLPFTTRREKYQIEKKGIEKLYNQIEGEIESKYKLLLEAKDQEISALQTVLSMRMEQQQATNKEDLQKIINDYEDVLNGLRREYEEKIVNLGKYYRKKAREYTKEKEKMQNRINQLEEENAQLKNQTLEQQIEQDKIPYSKKGMKKSHSQNSPFRLDKKDNEFKKVLDKINDYITNNLLESNELGLQSKKNTNSDLEELITIEPEFLQKMQASPDNQDSNLWAFNNNHHKPKAPKISTQNRETKIRKDNILTKNYYESGTIRERASFKERGSPSKGIYSPLMNNSAILSSFQSQERKNKLSFS